MSANVSSESELAERLGVDRRVVAAMRVEHLEDGTHWNIHAGHVTYTEEGVKAIVERLGVSLATGRSEKSAAVNRTDENIVGNERLGQAPMDMAVHRRYPNPTWVKAWHPDGTLVDVRVKDNRGMWIGFRMVGVVPYTFGRFQWAGKCPHGPTKAVA